MHVSRKMLASASVTLALGGLGAAAAVAQGSNAAPSHPKAPSTQADTDNIQQGDQTSPDAPGASPEAPAHAKTVAPTRHVTTHAAPMRTSAVRPAAPVKSVTSSDSTQSDSTNESTSETSNETVNDGPGGHQDAGDNVDHQFDGQE